MSESVEKSESVLLLENLTATLSQLLQQKSGLSSAMTIKLDGKNFNLWSQMLKMKLSGKDKLGYIDGSTLKPKSIDGYRKWQMEDSSVKDYIIESMDPSLVGNFLPFSTAKEVWDSIRTTFFDGDDLTQFFDLKRRVNRVKQGGGSVEVYYTQLQGLWKELDVRRPNPMTSPVDIEKYNYLVQEDRVLTFLDGLDDRLDSIRATVLQLKPFPTIEQAFALVRREENRQVVMLNKGDGAETSMVMLARNQTFGMNKPDFNPKPGLVEGCTYCHNPRHTREKCFKLIGYPPGWKDRKKKKQGEWHQYRGEAQMVAADSTATPIAQGVPAGPVVPTAAVVPATAASVSAGSYSLLPPVENKEHVKGKNYLASNNYHTNEFDWIIDSGATDHMTYSEKDLVRISTPRRTTIINANGESYPVKGAGDVQCSPSLTLSNTLLVPSLSTRLLSVGQVCEELNCAVLMYPQFCIFQDLLTKEIIGRGTRRGRLYHLDDMVVGKAHLSASSSTNRISRIWMWHKRLGHPSFGYLKKLYPSLFSGYEDKKFDCETCIRAKSHRVSFPSSLNKSTKPFDLVHSDVWGPSPVNSSVGNRWFVLFIDNCTRMTWLYVLKTKGEVSHVFKSFFNMVQNQFNRNIKILRSDNGGEFVNYTLREFFHSKGIIHETSCVGTPQQNGVAERKNRHILETARSMLLEYEVPQVYWDHAVASAVYLINRMPSNVLNFQTPLQVLSSHVPISSVLNLPPKIFGCVAFVHIQKHQRSKLEPCAERCVFVGYGQNQKGYKCLNPISQKLFVTMDVTFIETESFFRKDTIHSQGENLVENENWHQLGPYGNISTGSIVVNPNQTADPNSDQNQIIVVTNPNPATADPNLDAGTDPNPATAGPNTPAVSPSRAESERDINLWIELSMDPENEQRQLIQSPLPQLGQSPENEVQVLISENFNSNTGYRLPDRHNRGKPPKRFRPDEDGEGNYAIGKFVTTEHLPSPLKEFDTTLASVRIPERLEEAMSNPKWLEAMRAEMEALEKNHTWQLVSLPKGRKTVGCKWVFTVKYGPTGLVDRYKARLVAKGFTQTYGIDFQETFSPVAKLNTIRILLSLAANLDWPLHQFDVKNAFLHGDLEEEIYMEIPPGYSHSGSQQLVCKLEKALYGLKQSPRAWFGRFCSAMNKYGYTQSDSDHTLFYRKRHEKIAVLIIYVDDMIITGDDQDEIDRLEKRLSEEFEMKDLGGLKYFLGIEVVRTKEGISLSQRKYVLDLLTETGMLDCKPVDTPVVQNLKLGEFPTQVPANKERYQRLVGKLIYLSHTRPDIAYAVSLVSQFMHTPSEQHMEAVFRILRYLKGAPGRGIYFKRNGHLRVEGYTDSDWAGDITDRKSTSGYFTFVGGNLVTWRSKKQKVVALSSAEAEFMGITKGLQELIWLKKIMSELGFDPSEGMKLFCDNKAAIAISHNPVQHDRTKHIEVSRHFIRQNLEENVISLPFVRTGDQLADILTKGVSSAIFHGSLGKLGMTDIYAPT